MCSKFSRKCLSSATGKLYINIITFIRACLKSFDKKGRVGDNRKKQAGDGENASIPK